MTKTGYNTKVQRLEGELKEAEAALAAARKDIEIKDAQIAVISEMYDRVHTERDELLRQIGERGENPNYVEGRNFDKVTEDHLTEASDKRRDALDGKVPVADDWYENGMPLEKES